MKLIVQRSIFPLTGFSIILNDEKFNLKPFQKKIFAVEQSGTHHVRVKSYWKNQDFQFDVCCKDETVVYIKHTISDYYYIVGGVSSFTLAYFTCYGSFSAYAWLVVLFYALYVMFHLLGMQNILK